MEYGPPPLFRQGISAKLRFIFFVLISVILILVDGRLRSLDNFRSAVTSFTTPLVNLATMPGEFLQSSEGYFISKIKLKNANDQLSEDNQRMSIELTRFRELQAENVRLRRLVGAVPRTSDLIVTGEVIRRVADQFTRRIQINLGEKDGVRLGMPVLGADGVLGQVSRVINHQSEVTLLTDHRQTIAVSNERTGGRYIAAGTGEDMIDLRFVLPGQDVQAGDKIVTSGLDGLFPRNLLVGTVATVSTIPGESYQSVLVKPALDLYNTEFATVILTNPEDAEALSEQNTTDNIRRRAGR